MKKRNLIQKMMAVLLAVLLVMGMAQSGVVSVLAQEDATEQESVSENTEADEEIGNLQALLERIAALSDAEEYLATEPDVDSGEADEGVYEQWMAGLNAYAQEALAIQEAVEELSEEEQAGISEEALAKLATWVKVAEQVAESSMVMTVEEPTSGTCGNGLTWTLADGVLTISGSGAITSYAFSGKNAIKKVVINEGVTSIEMYAFKNCSLTSITIPASVKNIETCAFYECGSLTSITISEGVESIGGNAFYNCNSLTSITIPASVTSIESNAFHECSKLTRVELPGELTAINGGTFWECSSLTSITIPASVTSIGNFAFAGCSSLTNIAIPAGVTSIGQSAFKSCSSLTSITIPESVTSIGSAAFYDCSGLTEVAMESKTPPSLGNTTVFYNCGCTQGSTKGIHVPVGTVDTYKQATGWSTYKDHITDGTASAEEHKHDGVTFTAWTATDSLPDTAGNYYLTDNVTLPATWNVPNGTTNLCLNGKTITQTTTREWTISIGSGSTCKLYDCKDGGKITGKRGVSVGGGAFEIYGGSISGISSNYAAVYVHDQGTFHMRGGTISDNQNNSVGVNSDDMGGGVNVNKGTFYMSGGEISHNSKYGSLGDGVSVYAGVFYMSGGKISENKNGVKVGKLAEFHMSGGEVSGNTGAYGGGVSIGGTMTVGGNIEITGNAGTNGEEKNLFIIQSGAIQIDTSNPLEDSVNIGVTTATAPTDASPVSITGENGADYSGNFHSDNADYEIANGEKNVVQLTVKASPDTQPPTGKIEIEDNSWTQFLDPITYRLFFREAKQVTITAQDEDSGVDKIYYYISGEDLTRQKVETLGADKWTEGSSFSIAPDKRCIIYVKITDKAGNITYLSSDGLVFDATPPVINGVTDGETYNTPQTVTVTDAMSGVKSVTVNGTEVTLTDNQFTLGTSDKPQIIAATDKAGNTTAVTVTVKAQTQSYAVTVHNGTGTGIYRAGDTVTVTANAPASGKQFDKWEVNSGSVTLADSTSSTTTFTMPERDVKVEATYKDITEEHTHNYGDWQHDDTQHWKVCSCGDETGRGNHDYGDWITDKAATAAEAGTRHRECQTCHYRQTETIPATGGSSGGGDSTGGSSTGDGGSSGGGSSSGAGKVEKDVQTDGKAPDTQISTPKAELENMLLTDAEKQQVQNGTDITIVLEVNDAGDSVNDSDKVAVQQALSSYTVGQYLNIDLYKLAGQTRTDITETAKKIRIVLTVPDSLKNADSSKTRSFAVIRVHDGSTELLADLDDSADTITIETDRFSTYAVVYKDTANGGNDDGGSDNNDGGSDNESSDNNGGGNDNDNSSQNNSDKNDSKPGNGKDDEPETGDTAPIELYATLAMIAGFAYLLLYFSDHKRGMTEETKKELVSRLIGWAKQGGKIRKCLAFAAIFVLLLYYHSIGKKMCAGWKEIYE